MHFSADLGGAPNQKVEWAVADTDGGTIDANGSYIAPSTEGIYTVTASLSGTTRQESKVNVRRGVRVSLTPSTAAVAAGRTIALVASVSGTSNKAVTWSVAEAPNGGSIAADGTYTAPATAGVYHAVATSVADPTNSDTSTITVTDPPAAPVPPPVPPPVVVAVSPQAASVVEGDTIPLTATVSGTTNTAVTWSIAETGGGTVDANGLYTAPLIVGTFHVVARSVADPTKSAPVTVTVTPTPATPATPATSTPTPTPGNGFVPAFLGAQGGGALSKGGRGGTVYRVTNLNDSGTGSLRACVTASGPRTCVFAVAGSIVVSSTLQVDNPYLTIAGQTAPGGGVQVVASSSRPTNMALFRVNAHDVVVRNIRFRQNSVAGEAESGGNGSFGIGDNNQNSYNLILDHVSSTAACGKQFSIWSAGPGPNNVTIQWSILGYPVQCAAGDGGVATFITGSDTSSYTDYQTDIDLHHNLFTTSYKRLPLFKSKSGRFVNNIVYNWFANSLQVGGGSYVDVINNYWKPGPGTSGSLREVGLYDGNATTPSCGGATPCHPWLYVSGNKSDWHTLAGTSADASNWSTIVCHETGEGDAPCDQTPPTAAYQRTSPLLEQSTWDGSTFSQSSNSGIAITEYPSDSLMSVLIPSSAGAPTTANTVGVSQRVNCLGQWVGAIRDSADTQALTDALNGTGYNYSPATPPAYPNIAAVSGACSAGASDNTSCACLDSDGDGIPDAYEDANGLDKNNPADANVVQSDGFTNLEHFMNGH